MKGREIIKGVMEKHRVGPKDFFGRNRHPHVARARADAIVQMNELGMYQTAIGRVMKRNVSTVQYWLNPADRQRRLARRQKTESRVQ